MVEEMQPEQGMAVDEEAARPGIKDALRRAWVVTSAVVVGLRTFLTAGLFMAAGAADQFDVVDIIGWIRALMGDSARVGAVVFIVAAIFFMLRFISKRTLPAAPQTTQTKRGIDEGE